MENDPIRAHQSRLEGAITKTERLRPMLKSCQDAVERSGVEGTSIFVGNSHPLNPGIDIVVFMKSLQDIVPLFRELAKEGLKTDKTDAYEDGKFLDVIGTRTYNLGPQCRVMAMIVGDSNYSGPSCRVEQVGVKEVPVYEVVCDEDATDGH